MEYSEAEVGLAWRLHGCVSSGVSPWALNAGAVGRPFDPFLVHSVTQIPTSQGECTAFEKLNFSLKVLFAILFLNRETKFNSSTT